MLSSMYRFPLSRPRVTGLEDGSLTVRTAIWRARTTTCSACEQSSSRNLSFLATIRARARRITLQRFRPSSSTSSKSRNSSTSMARTCTRVAFLSPLPVLTTSSILSAFIG
ncbi:hypothetical protein PAPHI01_2143 [Pancytospora philotis]|nr:hypothetical protein PAPHI01_2143 [Pancytospora philotis]